MSDFKAYEYPLQWHVAYRSASAPRIDKQRPFTRLKYALDFADMVAGDGGKAAVYAMYHDHGLRGSVDSPIRAFLPYFNRREYMVYKGRSLRSKPVRNSVKMALSKSAFLDILKKVAVDGWPEGQELILES